MNDDYDINEEIDNEKLMNELDNLEDDANSKNAISKEKGNRKLIIIILLIIIIGIGIYFYKQYESYDFYDEYTYSNYEYEQEMEEAKFEIEKANLVIADGTVNVNGELVIKIVNENMKVMNDLEIYAIFYDNENKIIDMSEEYIEHLSENSSYYLKFEETPKNFTRYDIFIDKEYFYDDDKEDYDLSQNLEFAHELKDDTIYVYAKNNSEEMISNANFSIVYYDNDKKILDMEKIWIYDLKKGKTGKVIGYGVYNINEGEYVPFSSYEVILDYAY